MSIKFEDLSSPKEARITKVQVLLALDGMGHIPTKVRAALLCDINDMFAGRSSITDEEYEEALDSCDATRYNDAVEEVYGVRPKDRPREKGRRRSEVKMTMGEAIENTTKYAENIGLSKDFLAKAIEEIKAVYGEDDELTIVEAHRRLDERDAQKKAFGAS
jgi:hypothetical protein